MSGTPAAIGPQPQSGTTWLAATGTNAYRSTDNGLTWTIANTGLLDPFNGITLANFFIKTPTGRILRGGDNSSWNNRVGSPLWYSDDDGQTWSESLLPFASPATNPAGIGFTAFTAHNGAIYAADQLSQGVWKSTDNGLTWSAARNGIPTTLNFPFQATVLSSVTSTASAVFATGIATGIHRSTDGGANWTYVGNGLGGTGARDIVALTNGTLFARVNDNSLFRSTDNGDSWVGISLPGQGNITSVATDGTRVFAFTNSQKLLESVDGGNSFSIVDGGTPPPLRTSNKRQLAVSATTALYASATEFWRLDLTTAPRIPILPTILTQPVGGGVNVGTSFTFGVGISNATAPLTYTWKRGTTVIATTSVPSYTLASATLDDAGSWSVTITNPAGSIDSASVSLIVAPFAPGQIDYSLVPLAFYDVGALSAYGVAQGRDGEVFVIGAWSPAFSFNMSTQGLARIGVDGRPDTGFYSDSGVLNGNAPYALLPLPDGSMIVGGGALNNLAAQYFRKINRAGRIEPAFLWPATFSGGTFALLAGPEGSGTAYAAGVYGVRRFFTASGEEDYSFNPPLFPLTNTRNVRSLATTPDGSLVIGGTFTSINGIAQNRIARIRADGSLDVSFAPPGIGSSNGFNDEIYEIAVQVDGRVVVAGAFTSFGGSAVPPLVRLNVDGTLDTSFSPGAINGGVNALAIGLDGGIYVGGSFTTIGGAPANRLARLQGTNGDLDTSFPGQVAAANVNTLSVQPDGRLLVGNATTAYRVLTPAVATPRIARFNRDQTLVAGAPVTLAVTLAGDVAGATFQWHKDGAPLAGRTAATLPIAAFSGADEGAYHVVATVGSTVLTSPSARLDLLGVPEFVRPPAAMVAHPGVAASLVGEARGIGPLTYQWYKDGNPVSGATATFLSFANPAFTDASDYSLRVTGPGGTINSTPVRLSVLPRPVSRDSNFQFAGGDITLSGINSYSALQQPDGSLLVGGFLNVTPGGTLAAGNYYLLHLNEDGSIRTVFDNTAYGLQSTVRWLARLTDGKILVGDARQPRRLLANLQPDPSYTPANLGNLTENITALVVQPDDKVIVGFYQTSGSYTRLARLNANGTLDTTFPDLDPNGDVTALLRESDGTLYVAGDFTTIGGVARNGFARITPAGAVDPAFVPPPRTPMQGGLATPAQLARGPDGWLYLAGNFSKVGAIPANGLGRFDASGNPDPRFYLTGRPTMQGYSVAFTADRILFASRGGTIIGGPWLGTNLVAESFLMNGALDPASGGLAVSSGTNAGFGFLPLEGGRHLVLGLFSQVLDSGPPMITASAPMAVYTGKPGIAVGSHPQPAVVDLGGSVTLSAGAFGTSAITYQWYRNDQLLPGKTSASLLINPVTRDDEGTYTLVATNASGSVTSRGAFLDVRAEPEIVTAPQSVSRAIGQTFSLSVSAIGAGTLSYRWTKGGTDLADGGAISGSGTATLTITNAQETDSGVYAVRVTNAVASTTSATAVVNVILQPGSLNAAWTPAAPNGTVQQVIVRADGRLLITSAASGGFTTVGGASNSRPTVALLNEDGTLNTTFASIQTFPNGYTIRRFVLGPDGLTPYAAVSNGTTSFIFRYGADGVATTIHTITTGAITDLVVETPERITYAGNFTGRVARINIQGTVATADTTFVPPTFNDGVAYSIARRLSGGYVIGGSFSTINGTAYSRVIKISDQGALDTSFRPTINITVPTWAYLREIDGGKVIFGGVRLLPTGAADPAWNSLFNPNNWATTVTDMTLTIDGKLIVVGTFTTVGGQSRRGIVRLTDTGALDADFTSPTTLTGSLVGVGLGVNGRLYAGGSVTAYNGTTVNRLVRINHEPTDIAFVAQPQPLAANLDGSATFTAQAFGSSAITYRWLKDGTPLSEGGRFSGTATPSLTINPVTRGDVGTFRVEITNLAGTRLSLPAALTVLAEPVLVTSPTGGILPVGTNTSLAASFTGATPLTYSWTRNGNPVSNGGRFSGATTATLTITGITLDDPGPYVATASNTFGSAPTQPAAISVIIPPASLDASIPASLGANNAVTGLVPLSDGRFLVGGAFTSIGGQSRTYLAVLNANGTVDTSFTPPTMNGAVTRLFGLLDGSVIVAGSFATVAADTTNYRYLYKLTPALALDATFRPALNSPPTALVEESTGTLLLGGGFTSVGGVTTHPYLARVNATTGAFEPSLRAKVNSSVLALLADASGRTVISGLFTASGTDSVSGGPAYLARIAADGTLDSWAPGANNTVYALARDGSGRILAGGSFTSFSGGTISRTRLARFLADGTIDPDFTPAPNNTVRSIAVQDNGSILISGAFSAVGGTASARLARLLPSGSLDPAFEIGTGLGGSSTEYSDPIVIQPDGRIWLMGLFTTYKGTAVTYLVRLNGDPVKLAISRDLPAVVIVQPGAAISLPSGATGTSAISYAWTRESAPVADGGRVSGATTGSLQITGAVVADSGFYRMTATNASGSRQTRLAQVIVLDAPVIIRQPAGATIATATTLTLRVEAIGAGTLSYQWRCNGTPLENSARIAGATTNTLTITGLLLADSGNYTVVVSNTLGTATSEVAAITVFAPPAGIDPAFSTTGAPGNPVYAVAVESSGSVVLGGAFLGSQARLARILPNGTRDAAFAPTPNAPVTQITPLADGKVFVSGGFSQITGVSQLYLARLNAVGTRDTTFAPPAAYTPTATTINSHVVLPDGKVMLAGNFSAIGGVARTGFARLNANGTLDTTFVPTGTSGTGRAILPLADSGFLLGFSGAPYLIKVGSDGTKDTSFTLTPSFTVTHLARRADGGVIVAGDFGAFNGVNRAFLAALRPDLTHDSAWGSSVGLNNSISAIAVQSNGKVILGGSFTGNLRRLNADGTPDTEFVAGAFGAPGSPPVQSIAVNTLGPIWVGGQFTSYTGQTAGNLVRLNGDSGPPPDPYATWPALLTLPANQRGPLDDPDGDGFDNLIEYALDLNPNGSGGAFTGTPPTSVQSPAQLSYTYRRVRNDVTYTVETSPTLTGGTWTSVGVTQGTPGPDGTTTASIPITPGSGFLRLSVTR